MAGGRKKAGVLGVGGRGGGQINGLQGYPVWGGFVGVASGLMERAPQKIAAAGDQEEAEALGLQAFLGLGKAAKGQEQPAKEKEPGLVALVSSFPLPGAGQHFGIFHEGRDRSNSEALYVSIYIR